MLHKFNGLRPKVKEVVTRNKDKYPSKEGKERKWVIKWGGKIGKS